MLNKIKLSLNYFLPKRWLTELAGWAASKRAGWLTKGVIDLFVKYYRVDMQEAQDPDTASYRTFNAFFVRALREDVRPIDTDPSVLVMPADGVISQLGAIVQDKLLQAKGHFYSLEALLAGNYQMASLFRNGSFVTTYLSPRDYHRVHMPCNGILREMIYVPGDLFSVNSLTAQNVSNLFARNERVICLFDTEFGPMAQILVGATIVGSIETVWTGTVTPPREGVIRRWTWPSGDAEGSIALLKGQEMGRFKLGSTVINLFAPGKVTLLPHLQNLSVTRIGGPLGRAPEAGTDPADEAPESAAQPDNVTAADPVKPHSGADEHHAAAVGESAPPVKPAAQPDNVTAADSVKPHSGADEHHAAVVGESAPPVKPAAQPDKVTAADPVKPHSGADKHHPTAVGESAPPVKPAAESGDKKTATSPSRAETSPAKKRSRASDVSSDGAVDKSSQPPET